MKKMRKSTIKYHIVGDYNNKYNFRFIVHAKSVQEARKLVIESINESNQEKVKTIFTLAERHNTNDI